MSVDERTTNSDEMEPEVTAPTTESRHQPTWREMHMDTASAAEAAFFDLLRAMPTWRKLDLMEDLNRTARQIAKAGLRRRFPEASEAQLRRQPADLPPGLEPAARGYGPISP